MPLYIEQSGDLDRCHGCLTHSLTDNFQKWSYSAPYKVQELSLQIQTQYKYKYKYKWTMSDVSCTQRHCLILTLSSSTIWLVELFWLCLRNVKEFDQTDRHMEPFVTTRICEEGILQVIVSTVSSFKCETISNQKKIL